jgi:Asp-tRNA(Asn)/Glu-tRNA(Gln) amidotransferase A subunit family amidase
MSAELCWMSAADLARAIAKKKVSPVEVVDAVLARIEKLSTLNAYVTVDAEGARKAARAYGRPSARRSTGTTFPPRTRRWSSGSRPRAGS